MKKMKYKIMSIVESEELFVYELLEDLKHSI